jgi:hypothetical protein
VVLSAQGRLVALWIAQVARIASDYCFRLFVVLEMARQGDAQREAAWHVSTALVMLPAIFFCPLNGALSNALPKRGVLIGCAAYALAVVILVATLERGWLVGWGLAAFAAVLYGQTRYALLPSAAQDTGIPLTRINGWIELGAIAAMIGGMVLAGWADGVTWSSILAWFGQEDVACPLPWPVALAIAAVLSLICLLFSLPATFASDVCRRESALPALKGWWLDSRRILRHDESRRTLLGMAGFRGLVAALTGAFVAVTFQRTGLDQGAFLDIQRIAFWIMGGAALGSMIAGLPGSVDRALGLVPPAITGLLLAIVVGAWMGEASGWLLLTVGFLGGVINVPLAAAYQASLPANARGNGMAVRVTGDHVGMCLLSLAFAALAALGLVRGTGQLWLAAGLAALGAALAWHAFLPNFVATTSRSTASTSRKEPEDYCTSSS